MNNQKLYKQVKHGRQKSSALPKKSWQTSTQPEAKGSAVSHFQVLMFHQIRKTVWPTEAKEPPPPKKNQRKESPKWFPLIIVQEHENKSTSRVSSIGQQSQFCKENNEDRKSGGFNTPSVLSFNVVQHLLHPQAHCRPSPTHGSNDIQKT